MKENIKILNMWNEKVKTLGKLKLKEAQELFIEMKKESNIKENIYKHCIKAIEKSLNFGENGLPKIGSGDWNDGFSTVGNKGKGESVWLGFFQYAILDKFIPICNKMGDEELAKKYEDIKINLKKALNTKAWDGRWFRRAFMDDGNVLGSMENDECRIDSIAQSWSVISGFASKEQADTAMQSVADILDTPYGAKLLEPPYRHHYFDGALMHIFNPDTKENGGIFSQSQGWLILAEALLGHGNAAFRYFTESSPAAMNDKAEIRVMEPYVHGQFTESSASPYAGRAHVHWLTGTASTVMVGCVEGICGMRPDADGLAIRPSIPAEWDGMKMHKVFRGKQLNIIVQNPNHVESGVCALTLNGEALQGDYVPAEKLQDTNEIVVTLGK